MFIKIGNDDYELSTKMGVGKKIEDKFKQPIMQIFASLDQALTEELVTIISIAAGKLNDAVFTSLLYDEWDYTDLYSAVQELIARLMYGGTPEQQAAKIAKSPMADEQKNALRELLGLVAPSTATT